MPKPKVPMTIYHIDDECFSMGSKNRDTGKYPNSTKWMWGHIMTNKAVRTISRFAIMMDPEGLKAHYLTHGMFNRLKGMCEHIYLPVVKDEEVDAFCGQLQHLTADQLRRLLEATYEHPMYEDVCE